MGLNSSQVANRKKTPLRATSSTFSLNLCESDLGVSSQHDAPRVHDLGDEVFQTEYMNADEVGHFGGSRRPVR